MRRTHAVTTVALVATLLLGGCGGDDDAAPTPDTPVARAAVAELASRLEVTEGDVTVVEVEKVTWSDGSLGCAEQGKMYTQSLVEGHRITLRVDGEEHELHDGGDRAPFVCESPTQ